MDLIHVGHVPAYSHWKMESEGHAFEEIIILFDGRINVSLGEDEFDGREGDVFYYPSGVAHKEAARQQDPCETIFFSFFAGPETVSALPRKIHDKYGIIRTLATWAYEHRRASGASGEELCVSFLNCIISECRHLSIEPVQPLVELIREYVSEHLQDPIHLDDLAVRASMSKYHFSRTYKKLCGRTPMVDVTHLRLEHARNLILTTNLPLARIAEEVGFSDAYHISHLFRKHLNVKPSELRRKPL